MRFKEYFLTEATKKDLLSDEESIKKALAKLYIKKNFEIVKDDRYGFVVNVDGNVELSDRQLKTIPFKFGVITGNINLSNNNLVDFRFMPDKIDGTLYIADNNLTNIDFLPTEINGGLTINDNKKLTDFSGLAKVKGLKRIYAITTGFNDDSFKHLPNTIEILNITDTKVTSLHNIHKYIPNIGKLVLSSSNIKSHVLGLLMINSRFDLININSGYKAPDVPWFNIVKKYTGKTNNNDSIYECQEELIEANLDEYAQI